jgi:phosphoglycolate phosphatase-like HAD superfamily hydrolase
VLCWRQGSRGGPQASWRRAAREIGQVRRLILWDIDGTLMESGGVAGVCMRAAMRRIYGHTPEGEFRVYAGKTDRQILYETYPEREPAELVGGLEAFTAAYMEELELRRDELRARARVLAGVREVLARLAEADVVQSTLTGNLMPAARYKLDMVGLLPFFDMGAGAFGSDHHDRAELPAIAAARAAARYGRAFRGRDVVVIGDTPNDIACGRAYGARTVAVATGVSFAMADLAPHAPAALLPSLADTSAAVDAILGG